MVLLVVGLLTTAIVMRSFDRTKNVSNVRVNQRVLAATAPAIDRAEAKIAALLADPTLPRSTPTDQALYGAMTGNLPKYTLGDEAPLKLVYDLTGGSIAEDEGTPLDNNEALKTAWRFPVDTDNNGKLDSYSLYGVYFRNPSLVANRARVPLEARTPPMDNGSANGCAAGANTSASLVGSSGWYKTSDGNLKKSFYVFAATVPIINPPPDQDGRSFEAYKGNKGFAALEFQQDQARIPLTNNAVVYDDDLEITPGAGINLNGRIMTNSNLFIGKSDDPVRFYQVSSTESCFYTADNGKITVGGNVKVGSLDPGRSITAAKVDLFKEENTPDAADFTSGDASVTNTAIKTAYNSKAYAQRIDKLVQDGLQDGTLPSLVTEAAPGIGSPEQRKALENYFKDRTRRVPFAEVAQGGNALTGAGALGGVGNEMRPQDEWIYPTNLVNGAAQNSLTIVKNAPPATASPDDLGPDEMLVGDRVIVGNGLPAEWWNPDTGRFVNFYDKEELNVDGSSGSGTTWAPPNEDEPRTRMTQFVPLADLGDTDRDGFWEKAAAQTPSQPLDGVGGLRVVTGAGIYDPAPDNGPPNVVLPRPNINSLITDDYSTTENESALDDPTTPALEGFTVALPDSMPMWADDGDGEPEPPDANQDLRGDLIMRATAVYHYKHSEYPNGANTDQRPIACVSSYYNPSTKITALNQRELPGDETDPNGLSNNGITYGVPGEAETPSSIARGSNTDGVFDSPAPEPPRSGTNLRAKLNYQANLIFPNGRFVNEPLRAALKTLDLGEQLTLSNQSALASAVCALNILDESIGPDPSVIPHGAIKETAFLDPRQVKAIEKEAPSTNFSNPPAPTITTDYNLSLVEHQPLEIRATVLDLDKLRKNPSGGVTGTSVVTADEFLLPNSGIIYATRDDALLDLSAPGGTPAPEAAPGDEDEANARMATRRLNSPVDFSLDPTRRPNGIMLTNGSILARGNNDNEYKQEEKGLILVSNLPVYVKADEDGFNLHQSTAGGARLEEFRGGDLLQAGLGNFYTREDLEPSFACRVNQPGLTNCEGDLWRPATVLADSVTLLSNNFRFGFREEGDYDLRKNVDNLANNLRFKGFDWLGNGVIDTVDEATEGFDVNGDGDTFDNLPETEITGYDLDGSGKIGDFSTINEADLGFDLNGNGIDNDTGVSETQITITAARKLNGFFDNNYLTSAEWFDSTRYPKDFDTDIADRQGSSYVNNFVTPIQRRVQNFPEYLMEMCDKPLVEQCGPNDWWVYDAGTKKKASEVIGTPVVDLLGDVGTDRAGAGTTARLPLRERDRRYPRRVAFLRVIPNPSLPLAQANANRLVLNTNTPIPLANDGTGTVAAYPYSGSVRNPPVPNPRPTGYSALWFMATDTPGNPTAARRYFGDTDDGQHPLFYKYRLTNGTVNPTLAIPSPSVNSNSSDLGIASTSPPATALGSTQQPLLGPVLQLHKPTAAPQPQTNFGAVGESGNGSSQTWMQKPEETTTFNLIIAAGDTPARDAAPGTLAEFNGGMPNFPGFLEDWADTNIAARISGSFIQFKRSAYATAPYLHMLDTSTVEDVFGYPRNANLPRSSNGKSPYYVAPKREWGFDVGLLSQLPDLFSQKITTPSPGEPNRFYREVSRDDDWVKTLLCSGVQTDDGGTPLDPSDDSYDDAVDSEERPNGSYCQDIGANF
jgi:hypothetical protein